MTLTGTTAAHSPLSAAPKVTRYVGAVRAHRATLSGGGQILKQDAHYLQPHAALVWVNAERYARKRTVSKVLEEASALSSFRNFHGAGGLHEFPPP